MLSIISKNRILVFPYKTTKQKKLNIKNNGNEKKNVTCFYEAHSNPFIVKFVRLKASPT